MRRFTPESEPKREWPLASLEGLVAPAVLGAPKTAGDPTDTGQWPAMHGRSIAFLVRNVEGKPWANHLTLAGTLLSAQRLDTATVKRMLTVVNARLTDIFATLHLTRFADWDTEASLVAYLRGELVPTDSRGVRADFCTVYLSIQKRSYGWLKSLPVSEQMRYRPYLFPYVDPGIQQFARRTQLIQASQHTRKAETDGISVQFSDLRVEAHYRYNRMTRLRQAYLDAVRSIREEQAKGTTDIFPFVFSYDEGGDAERGTPAHERLQLRIWTKRSFMLAHRAHYSPKTIAVYAHRNYGQGKPSVDIDSQFYLEFVQAERLADSAPPESFWFLELFRMEVMGSIQLAGDHEEVARRRRWLESWGYLESGAKHGTSPFYAGARGVLNWTQEHHEDQFAREALRRTGTLFLPIEPLYAAATFGVLAMDVFTTTGMRINEFLQLKLTPDCFVRLQMPAPPGAKDQSPRIRYAFRLLPKGERTETLHNFFIGEETKRLLVKVARFLAEHYDLKAGAALPTVAYSPHYARAHRFRDAPYLLQYNHRALADQAITASMRFLLHGMLLRTRDAKPVILKPHLLRHAFATHTVQVEKIPIDIVGALLKQKNLDVTDYYSQPTESMVAEAHDLYLARVALRLDIGAAVVRSPEELQQLYREAEGRAGTLAEVIGGECVCHGYCGAKFACVGCAGKVPNPAKRAQVERHRVWALQQVEYATQEGLFPEAERMRQLVRDCDGELREMDQIESFRRDETHVPLIQITRRNRG